MASMAPYEVKVFKMSLLGPTATLATITESELRERWGLHAEDLPTRIEVLDKLTTVVVSENSADESHARPRVTHGTNGIIRGLRL
jgi:hypothetical protein